MEPTSISQVSKITVPYPRTKARNQIPFPQQLAAKIHLKTLTKTSIQYKKNINDETVSPIPTMKEILASSKAQNLGIQLQTLGPFFRITARSLETQNEIGRAKGLMRVWLRGRELHLDSIRLKRETLGMEKLIFGIGLFIGAVAIRYGYDCGCKTAELLAIND